MTPSINITESGLKYKNEKMFFGLNSSGQVNGTSFDMLQ